MSVEIIKSIVTSLESATSVEWINGDISKWREWAWHMRDVIKTTVPIMTAIAGEMENSRAINLKLLGKIDDMQAIISEKDQMIMNLTNRLLDQKKD